MTLVNRLDQHLFTSLRIRSEISSDFMFIFILSTDGYNTNHAQTKGEMIAVTENYKYTAKALGAQDSHI
jgi:hypothetical protein